MNVAKNSLPLMLSGSSQNQQPPIIYGPTLERMVDRDNAFTEPFSRAEDPAIKATCENPASPFYSEACLSTLPDDELESMGITRADLSRAGQPQFNEHEFANAVSHVLLNSLKNKANRFLPLRYFDLITNRDLENTNHDEEEEDQPAQPAEPAPRKQGQAERRVPAIDGKPAPPVKSSPPAQTTAEKKADIAARREARAVKVASGIKSKPAFATWARNHKPRSGFARRVWELTELQALPSSQDPIDRTILAWLEPNEALARARELDAVIDQLFFLFGTLRGQHSQ